MCRCAVRPAVQDVAAAEALYQKRAQQAGGAGVYPQSLSSRASDSGVIGFGADRPVRVDAVCWWCRAGPETKGWRLALALCRLCSAWGCRRSGGGAVKHRARRLIHQGPACAGGRAGWSNRCMPQIGGQIGAMTDSLETLRLQFRALGGGYPGGQQPIPITRPRHLGSRDVRSG